MGSRHFVPYYSPRVIAPSWGVMPEDMKSISNKTFDFVNHEIEIDRLIRSQFSDSQMSNAKWKKLFRHLAVICPESHTIWKFVGSDNDGVALTGLPRIDELEETFINHQFWFGPRYYKEIEWLCFPNVVNKRGVKTVSTQHITQDTDLILSELMKIGHWPIVQNSNGFIVYGHR